MLALTARVVLSRFYRTRFPGSYPDAPEVAAREVFVMRPRYEMPIVFDLVDKDSLKSYALYVCDG